MHEGLSPLDDRYREKVEPLIDCFSESAYLKHRAYVEQLYLRALLEELGIKAELEEFLRPVGDGDVEIIKKIEKEGWQGIPPTRHDGKAVEYLLKLRLPENLREYVHYGVTTDDISNLALGLMLKRGLHEHILPRLEEVLGKLRELAFKYKHTVMLARTHGQYASPTTFGKEMLVFALRLYPEVQNLKQTPIQGKLSCAVGTYSALSCAHPEVNWVDFSKRFVTGLGLEWVVATTQILPPEGYVRIFNTLHRINSILLDLCKDMWRYISDEWVVLKVKKGETGSSVMPHKVNPINFENAEGNLKIANSLLELFARELPVSRLQRDLSDSTVKRNFGLALGHSYLAYGSLLRGLGGIEVNAAEMLRVVQQHPEVLAEANQTVLREHMQKPYELFKDITRGTSVTLEQLHEVIRGLDVPEEVKQRLLALKPEDYVGEIDRIFE
ncbi:adenylosuccinate lyase, partial [Candidatus Woesearchaeota archaeon]|nr:adenylosuccinate lyase [Candidatus Woesearchaeota archaeon]